MTTPIRHAARGGSRGADALDPGRGWSGGPLAAEYPFLLPPINPDEIGRLGPYRVLRLLGQGGMGLVFQAEDVALCRPVALKVMRPELHQEFSGSARFLREARAMASIKHESLVTVFQVGQENGVIFLAMELLEGMSLGDWLERVCRPPLPVILQLGQQIAGGLAAIHRRGLVHRDLKPGNLWIEEPEARVKILDFGLARFIDDATDLTQTGAVLGTPGFMSPEQARGEPVDARSDLFSFGCVLYSLCTGLSPFHGNNTSAVLTALALRDPCPAHKLNPAIPEALSELVAQLLAKDPEERPGSADEVLVRLRQLAGQPHLAVPLPPAPAEDPQADDQQVLDLPTLPAIKASPPASRRRSRTRRRKRPPASRRWLLLSLAAVALVGCVGLGSLAAFLVLRGRGPVPTPEGWGSGRVYLSTLSPAAQENWPFQPPVPPGRPPISPLGGVSVQGRDSPHGIFMHAVPPWQGTASLTYDLRGACRTFQAQVSLNDGPPGSDTPVTFAVYGDGALLWKSSPVSTQADAQTCTVRVQGVQKLKIEVSCPGEPRGGHAVWVEPFLSR